MDRSRQHEAIVLKLVPFGESHAFAHLLSAEGGVVKAAAYGVRSTRGTLRGHVEPFARGQVYLQYTPRSDTYKISDFAVSEYHLAIRSNLRALYAAHLVTEVVLASYAGGGDAAVFALLSEALQYTDRFSAAGALIEIDRLIVHVLWRYLGLLGVQPDLEVCAESGRLFEPDETRYFSRAEAHFVSAVAARESMSALDGQAARESMSALDGQAARYLAAGASVGLEAAARGHVSRDSLALLRRFVLTVMQDQLHVPLKTIGAFAEMRSAV